MKKLANILVTFACDEDQKKKVREKRYSLIKGPSRAQEGDKRREKKRTRRGETLGKAK